MFELSNLVDISCSFTAKGVRILLHDSSETWDTYGEMLFAYLQNTFFHQTLIRLLISF